jgi:hypothetical protein
MEMFWTGTERTEDKYGAKSKRAIRVGNVEEATILKARKDGPLVILIFVCRGHDFARHVHLARGRVVSRLHLTMLRENETWINNAGGDPCF